VIGAILLTTLASKASDSFKIGDALLAHSGPATETARCPKEMVYVPTSQGGFCIDQFEASVGALCPRAKPTSEIQTNENIAIATCVPDSAKEKDPWVNVSYSEAMTICARSGKRLPSPGEWYRAALGTPDSASGATGCVLGRVGLSDAEKTGAHSGCVSSFGAYDMVGNVWEWVDTTVSDGLYNSRTLPSEGFVAEADADGVPTLTGTTSALAFGNDYFFAEPSGVRGMFRGGFWGLAEKAGIFSVNTTIQPSFAGSAVGFRCVK
jgi:formylglycine-generating enzyme required for sulfatase activity